MNAEIINIGDEILIGQISNTNATWMAEQLILAGISTNWISVIGDDHQQILNSLDIAINRADIVLITGGLGPTKDDITKQALCDYFNTELVFNEEAYIHIEELFSSRGFQVTEVNKRQAEIPAICKPIKNINGTAPGMWFDHHDKIVISMPGVPFEMKAIMTDQLIPKFKQEIKSGYLINRTVLTQGIGESNLAEIIEDWESNLPTNIKLAYLPQPGLVRLRLSGNSADQASLKLQIDDQLNKLHMLIPHLIFGYEDDSLELIIGQLLTEKKATLSTAESCTGGYISHLITSIPGSSSYYSGSVVSYSNEIKERILGVKEQSLIDYGAVSKDVVEQMAIGARIELNTDYAIASSGIAGPDGGTEDKPVGTTWIAIAGPQGRVFSKRFLFGEHRGRNIRKAALFALNMLRKEIIGENLHDL